MQKVVKRIGDECLGAVFFNRQGDLRASTDFAQTNNCPSSIGAGQFCLISVTYTPTAAGDRDGTITISSNAPGPATSIFVIGSGLAAYEAEGGVLGGSAKTASCASCSGGTSVTRLGSVRFNVTATRTATYGLTIYYVNNTKQARILSVSINGGSAVTLNCAPSGSTPAVAGALVNLAAGSNTIQISGVASSPDLDRITVQ